MHIHFSRIVQQEKNSSARGLNFAGFDYSRAWEKFGSAFEMYTVVGVKDNRYNQKLFPKLNNRTLIKIIEDIYSPCCFDRRLRFNKASMTFSASIKRYDSLADYLRDVLAGKIYLPSETPTDCINKLKAILNGLGLTTWDNSVHEAIDKLQRYAFDDYNLLEHLHIVTSPPIDCRRFLNKDPATLAEFERQFAQHIVGMIMLDLVFNEDPATVAKINALIPKLP